MVLLLDLLRVLFRYPPGSGRELLAGTLPLRYGAARFACLTPTWRLPVSDHVVDLAAADIGAVREASVDGAAQEVFWVRSSDVANMIRSWSKKYGCVEM